MIEKAKSLLNEAEFIKEIAKTYQDPFEGQIKIGGIPTLATYLFPNLLTNLFQKPQKLLVVARFYRDTLYTTHRLKRRRGFNCPRGGPPGPRAGS